MRRPAETMTDFGSKSLRSFTSGRNGQLLCGGEWRRTHAFPRATKCDQLARQKKAALGRAAAVAQLLCQQ